MTDTDPNNHNFKKSVVAEYATKYHLWTLIETGTYLGEMVEWASSTGNFDKVISIELSQHYYERAVNYLGERFNVELIYGNSADVLPDVLRKLDKKALFWLDAHYSEGKTEKGNEPNPVLWELFYVLKDKFRHVVLIDDARLFGHDGWPTLENVKIHIKDLRPDAVIEVTNDIIRVT